MKNKSISFIVKVGLFGALSTVLYVVPGLQFPLPFIFPSFLDIQFSNLPAILCGFLTGPVGGTLVVLIRCLIKCIVRGSGTVFVGELADVTIGISVVLVTSLIYRRNHTKKGGKIALAAGCGTWVVVATLMNWLVLVPTYIELFFGGNLEVFVSACSVIPFINQSNYMGMYLLLAVIPFNTLLSVLTSIITYIVYKKTSVIFNRFDTKISNNEKKR